MLSNEQPHYVNEGDFAHCASEADWKRKRHAQTGFVSK